jgi:uncharacterized protein YukE
MTGKPISAHFDGVAEGAKQIIKRAEDIRTELEQFNKKVEEFAHTQGGAANEAFLQYQGVWNQQVVQLNATLAGAGQLVNTGNAELQGTDSALANLF